MPGWLGVRMNITILTSDMRSAHIEKSVYSCPYWDFMSIGVQNLVGLSCHEIFSEVSLVNDTNSDFP